MAEDVVHQSVAVPHAEPAPLVRPGNVRAEDPRVYRWRFGIAYVVLAVLAGAGIGAAVMFLQRPADPEPAPWTAWQPTGRDTSFADQIADYVGPRYLLPDGRAPQVVASRPVIEGVPLQRAVVEHRSPLLSGATRSETFDMSSSIMYTVCGRGPQCSIPGVEASPELLRLLSREALELSLYTFKYFEGVESTMVLLPTDIGDPNDPADDTSTALFLEKKHFTRELSQPLTRTLADPPPEISGLTPAEVRTVDRLTRPNLFAYQGQQLQTGAGIVFLTPVNARP